MLMIGCDYHPAFQQIAFVDTATGECPGEEAGGSLVLDDAQEMGFRNVNKVRFARGKARNRRVK